MIETKDRNTLDTLKDEKIISCSDVAVPDSMPISQGNNKRLKIFGLILVAQVGALFAFAMPYAQTLEHGKTAILNCRSYDPRDPLKGDYVASTFDFGEKVNFKSFKPGETAYVKLKEHKPYWQGVSASANLPNDLKNDEAVIKVTVNHGDYTPPDLTTGVERFYVSEGMGADVDYQHLTAEVALGADGSPVLKRMFSNGAEVGKAK